MRLGNESNHHQHDQRAQSDLNWIQQANAEADMQKYPDESDNEADRQHLREAVAEITQQEGDS